MLEPRSSNEFAFLRTTAVNKHQTEKKCILYWTFPRSTITITSSFTEDDSILPRYFGFTFVSATVVSPFRSDSCWCFRFSLSTSFSTSSCSNLQCNFFGLTLSTGMTSLFHLCGTVIMLSLSTIPMVTYLTICDRHQLK